MNFPQSHVFLLNIEKGAILEIVTAAVRISNSTQYLLTFNANSESQPSVLSFCQDITRVSSALRFYDLGSTLSCIYSDIYSSAYSTAVC